MADVVGVVFHNGTKTYHFDPAGLELSRGDSVVVQTMKGTEIGQVVEPPHLIDDSELPAPLKKVVRLATEEDLETQASAAALRKEAMIACRELISSHGLDMKLVDADVSFGGEKITFSFYSDERVDFRGLVADLARTLKMRIELRQIGAREEARMVGGLGPCGRHLCCSLFQGDEDPVSIRMAKEQNLPLNPMKISGLCGRLMCCLKYEQEQYVTFRKEAPPKGTPVKTGDIEGAIIGYNVLKDAIVVRFQDGSISDVRLKTCECDENGCLNCAREEEKPVELPMPGVRFGAPLESAQDRVEEPDRAERVESPAAGSPSAESGGAEGEARTEGRPRSRRSRGRRGGRGRGTEGAPANGEQGAPTGEAASSADSVQAGGGRGPRHRLGQRPSRTGEGSPERAAGGQGQPGGENVPGEAGEGAAKRPRRRRRPRRRGAGGGEGGGSGGDGGNAGGSPGGDS